MIKFSLNSLQKHPDSRLQIPWKFAQIGVLLLPFFPLPGSLCLAIALLGTWRQKFPRIITHPSHKAFAILSLLLILMASFAERSLDAFLGLANLLPFFLFFATFNTLIQSIEQLRQLSWLFIFSSIPVIFVGLIQQFFQGSTPPFFHQIFGWSLELHGNPPGRMSAVFMHANLLAFYVTIVLTLTLGLFIEERQKLSQLNWELSPQKIPLIVLSILFLGNGIVLIFTHSRNAWGLAVLVMLIFAIYCGWKKLIIGGISGISILFLSAFGPDPIRSNLQKIIPAFFWARLNDQMYPNRPVSSLRITQWKFTLNMIQERPWTGWGLRNFSFLYESQMQEKLQHPHNLILMLTAETGIPTTLLFCSIIGVIFAQGIWLFFHPSSLFPKDSPDSIIYFSYLLAFMMCIIFNGFDVTLFDLRSNIFGWLLLSAIGGIVSHTSPQ